ncbi:glycosyl hydrolase [Silvimonas terrae]|uniref:glycosyl hydrolase n=1 Tax=Silvimonas terrae TaxID=300266 RepID=UPI001C85EA8A|nr:glycosyl hydrolase [Silvimonas terrae]
MFTIAALSVCLTACGGGGSSDAAASSQVSSPSVTPTPTPTPAPSAVTKSFKRGVGYDFANSQDLAAVSPGVTWWYNWGLKPNASLPANAQSSASMDFVPMLWNGNFVDADVISYLRANPAIKYLLVLNEPNLVDQANMTPAAAAALWPRYEAISAATGVKLVGPAMNWGTLSGYSDPVVWLDAFYAAFRASNNRDPQIDYLAFHWYDYGLADQLNRLTKYGKPFWVTEFANWHSQTDGAQIDTLAKQEAQMADMVNTCETRTDVFRYAWFTGRLSPDPHFDSLLAGTGVLTDLGSKYLTQPW